MTNATICRDEVLMYDGNLVAVELDVEVHCEHDCGDRWTPSYTSCEAGHIAIISIDAYDADDNEIQINLDDEADPYVQSVNQHIEEGTIDFDDELYEAYDPYDDGYDG